MGLDGQAVPNGSSLYAFSLFVQVFIFQIINIIKIFGPSSSLLISYQVFKVNKRNVHAAYFNNLSPGKSGTEV